MTGTEIAVLANISAHYSLVSNSDWQFWKYFLFVKCTRLSQEERGQIDLSEESMSFWGLINDRCLRCFSDHASMWFWFDIKMNSGKVCLVRYICTHSLGFVVDHPNSLFFLKHGYFKPWIYIGCIISIVVVTKYQFRQTNSFTLQLFDLNNIIMSVKFLIILH